MVKKVHLISAPATCNFLETGAALASRMMDMPEDGEDGAADRSQQSATPLPRPRHLPQRYRTGVPHKVVELFIIMSSHTKNEYRPVVQSTWFPAVLWRENTVTDSMSSQTLSDVW
eukprot:6482063-Amphidinium_carterae.3